MTVCTWCKILVCQKNSQTTTAGDFFPPAKPVLLCSHVLVTHFFIHQRLLHYRIINHLITFILFYSQTPPLPYLTISDYNHREASVCSLHTCHIIRCTALLGHLTSASWRRIRPSLLSILTCVNEVWSNKTKPTSTSEMNSPCICSQVLDLPLKRVHLRGCTSLFAPIPSISFPVRCCLIMQSIPGIKTTAPRPAGRRSRSAYFSSTTWVERMWEITRVSQRSGASRKSWCSTSCGWRAGQRLVDCQALWSGFVWWLLWLRVSPLSPDGGQGNVNNDHIAFSTITGLSLK